MSTVKTMGIVTHSIQQGESDRIVTLLSEDLGRIQVSASGARRSGHRLSPGTQVFAYGEFVLFRGRTMFRMNACDVRISFYDLASDLDRLSCATGLAAVADDACTSPEPAAEVVRLLVIALMALRKGAIPPDLLTAAFVFRILHLLGMTPHVTGCVKCGTKSIDRIGFGFESRGLLCEDCMVGAADAMILDTGCVKAMLHVLVAPERDAFRFALDAEPGHAFVRFVQRYADAVNGGIRYPDLNQLEKYKMWRSP